MIEAYPLYWPIGKKRTQRTERSRFKSSFSKTRDELVRELKLMGARLPIISTNIPLRHDGLPYANYKEPTDKGVAVYFTWKDKQMCFCCDRWDNVNDNLKAVKNTIEALRGIDRWGTGDMLEAAFSGFAALPPPESEQSKKWFEVLGVSENCTLSIAETSYRDKAKNAHPDNGGTQDEMVKLNAAIKQARVLKQ